MEKINEFEISMVCYNEDNKYTLEEINDMLIEWAESKDIFLGGSVKPCVEEENSKESAALPLHDVSNRRKLLIAFMESLTTEDLTQIEIAEFDNIADKFLGNL